MQPTVNIKDKRSTSDNDLFVTNHAAHITSVDNGVIDFNNDTETPLLSGQTFTGTATDVSNYASIGLMVYTDVNSADDGLVVQYSFNGTTWRDGEAYTIPANTTKFFTPPKQGKYYRVSYTNNGSNQSEFHIHSLLSKTPIKWSSHNINDNLNDDDDSELVSAVLKLRTAQNNYVSGAATNSGNFKVSIEEFDSSVSTDTNKLNVAPYLINEDGVQAQMLTDTYFTGSPVVIDSAHHEIHCGDSLTSFEIFDLGTPSGTRDILIKVPNPTPSSKRFHFDFSLISEGECEARLYEGTVVSADGTAKSFYNRNRQDPVSSESEVGIFHTPTVTNVGTNIDGIHFGSGRGSGGEARGEMEWVLLNNTNYLIRLTNFSIKTNHITLKINYYVHPGI